MTNLQIGQTVINFGVIAKVVGFHEITGAPILEAEGIGKWIADPAKCKPAGPMCHRDGFVLFG